MWPESNICVFIACCNHFYKCAPAASTNSRRLVARLYDPHLLTKQCIPARAHRTLTMSLTCLDVAQTLRRRLSCRHEHPLVVSWCCVNTASTFIISPRTAPPQNQWFLERYAAVHPAHLSYFNVASMLLQFCFRMNFCIDLSCLLNRTYGVLLHSRSGECEALGIRKPKASRPHPKASRLQTKATIAK